MQSPNPVGYIGLDPPHQVFFFHVVFNYNEHHNLDIWDLFKAMPPKEAPNLKQTKKQTKPSDLYVLHQKQKVKVY